MTPKVRAAEEWADLVSAMDRVRPSCRGDNRFIADRESLTTDDLDAMEATCWRCPLRDTCLAFAAVERPSGGFWAGRYWKGTR